MTMKLNRILPVMIAVAVLGSATVRAAANEWTRLGPYGGDVRALAIDPQNSSTVYVASQGAGIFKSTDGGASWSSANSGLTTTYFDVLAIDPQNPSTLYAGGDGIGLFFKSTDGGTSWSAVNFGLPSPSS